MGDGFFSDKIRHEEKGERNLIMKLLIFLYNYRANKVGINQIRNTYLYALNEIGNSIVRL